MIINSKYTIQKWIFVAGFLVVVTIFVVYFFAGLPGSSVLIPFINVVDIFDSNKTCCTGIVCDTPAGWKERLAISINQHKFDKTSQVGEGQVFFQNNWEPTFSCEYEKRIGKSGDGGKWICNPCFIPRPSLVYSLGSSNEFSFETMVFEQLGNLTEIHTFDFGDGNGVPPFVNYHKWGIGSNNEIKDGIQFKDIDTIINDLGHKGRIIDIFKIDIEGNEGEVLIPLFNKSWPSNIRQIQIEVHLMSRFSKMTPLIVHDLFTLMIKYGYEIFHKEPNTEFSGGGCCEFSLVKVNWSELTCFKESVTKV